MRVFAFSILPAIAAGIGAPAQALASVAGAPTLSAREAFLAAAIAAMVGCGLASFLLSGRVAERTHVALALIVVLIGGFCLLTLFGLSGREFPVAGVGVVLGLVGLFKLMNQFEIRARSQGRTTACPREDRPR